MDEHDERTSLVRSDRTMSNDYTTNNGHHNNINNNNHSYPSRTASGRDNNDNTATRRDARAVLSKVQQSVVAFQTWAAEILLRGNKEGPAVVQWVQNARVARTFMMIVNVFLAVLAFVLMGVEMVEMALREPILDYLLPENEMTLYIAGFSIVAGAFGFAVAYNLLVGQDDAIKEDGDDEARRSGGGNGRDSGPRTTSPSLLRPTDNMLGQNSGHPVVPQQQVRRPRLMFTKASTYLLNGNAIFLAVLLFVFTIAIAQRSAHLSQMDKELNNAWTDSIRHRTSLISDFELRHRCCGYDSITNRPFPPIVTKPPKEGEEPKPQTCHENPAYGFKVPCKAELHKDFGRWQKRIQQLLLVQVTMMVPLLLLVMTLSAIGISKLRERKQEGLEEAEAQTEGTATVPVMVNGRELPLLVDVAPHNDGMPILIDVDAEPVRVAQDRRPVVQPTLI